MSVTSSMDLDTVPWGLVVLIFLWKGGCQFIDWLCWNVLTLQKRGTPFVTCLKNIHTVLLLAFNTVQSDGLTHPANYPNCASELLDNFLVEVRWGIMFLTFFVQFCCCCSSSYINIKEVVSPVEDYEWHGLVSIFPPFEWKTIVLVKKFHGLRLYVQIVADQSW